MNLRRIAEAHFGLCGMDIHVDELRRDVDEQHDGWMAVDSAGFQIYKGEASSLAMEEKAVRGSETAPHMTNFLNACRTRNAKDLNADIAIGAMSAALCHLANASYRVGRKLTVEPGGRFANDAEANALLTRKYRAPYVV